MLFGIVAVVVCYGCQMIIFHGLFYILIDVWIVIMLPNNAAILSG